MYALGMSSRIEEDEEMVQYSQVHHPGPANDEDADYVDFGSMDEDGD